MHIPGGSEVTGLCCNFRSHLTKNTQSSASQLASFVLDITWPVYEVVGRPYPGSSIRSIVPVPGKILSCFTEVPGLAMTCKATLFRAAAPEPQKTSTIPSSSEHRHSSLNLDFQVCEHIQDATFVLAACFSPSKELRDRYT